MSALSGGSVPIVRTNSAPSPSSSSSSSSSLSGFLFDEIPYEGPGANLHHLPGKSCLTSQNDDGNTNVTATRGYRKVVFSESEERRLIRGVRRFGKDWVAILKHYRFNRRRTNVSLQNKWRNLSARVVELEKIQNAKFTAEEDLVLEEAVRSLGSEWSVILERYKSSFEPGRTRKTLQQRWRTLEKRRTRTEEEEENKRTTYPTCSV